MCVCVCDCYVYVYELYNLDWSVRNCRIMLYSWYAGIWGGEKKEYEQTILWLIVKLQNFVGTTPSPLLTHNAIASHTHTHTHMERFTNTWNDIDFSKNGFLYRVSTKCLQSANRLEASKDFVRTVKYIPPGPELVTLVAILKGHQFFLPLIVLERLLVHWDHAFSFSNENP